MSKTRSTKTVKTIKFRRNTVEGGMYNPVNSPLVERLLDKNISWEDQLATEQL